MKVYIAAPFFNPGQLETVERIKTLLTNFGIEYFSPKDECMFEKGVTKPKDILRMNVNAIEDCDLMIAVTEGKDMGTLFECGYAYAMGIDVIYFWETDDTKMKFNLMLSGSGYGVAKNYKDLADLVRGNQNGRPAREYDGGLE